MLINLVIVYMQGGQLFIVILFFSTVIMNILLSRILFQMELLSDIYIDLFGYLLVLPVFSVAYIVYIHIFY